MMKSAAGLLLAFIIVFSASGELQDLDGSQWVNEEYHWSLEFQTDANYSYSNITVRNETLSIQDKNISMLHNSSERLNTTLYKYNLSSPSSGDTLIKIEAQANSSSEVEFGFTGLPSISSGKYELKADNSLENFTSSNISWNYSSWSSQNFTVDYVDQNPVADFDYSTSDLTVDVDASGSSDPSGISSYEWDWTSDRSYEGSGETASHSYDSGGDYDVELKVTDTDGNTDTETRTVSVSEEDDSESSGGGGGSGGSYEPPLEVEGDLYDSQSWAFTDRSGFSFQPDTPGLREVSVETVDNVSDFEIAAGTDGLDAPEAENGYRYYDIEADTELSSGEITFEVNRSFVDSYDSIVLSRYEEGWDDLETEELSREGDIVVYRAGTEGFSYFASRGIQEVQAQEDQEETRDETRVQVQNNQTEETEGSNQTQEENEGQDRPNEEVQRLPIKQLMALLGLIAVTVLGYFGYRYWRQRSLEKLSEEIRETIEEKRPIADGTQIIRELDQAEKAIEEGAYSEAKKKLKGLEERLEE
jgi:hypothetical protein